MAVSQCSSSTEKFQYWVSVISTLLWYVSFLSADVWKENQSSKIARRSSFCSPCCGGIKARGFWDGVAKTPAYFKLGPKVLSAKVSFHTYGFPPGHWKLWPCCGYTISEFCSLGTLWWMKLPLEGKTERNLGPNILSSNYWLCILFPSEVQSCAASCVNTFFGVLCFC